MTEHAMTIPALRDPYHGEVHWISDAGHAWLAVPAELVRASGASITPYSYLSPDGTWAYLEEDCDAPAYLDAMGRDQRAELPLPEYYCDGEAYVRELSPWPA